MKSSSKYWPLFEYLRQSGQNEVTMHFEQIEALLGAALPASARHRRDWWGNRRSALQAAAWMQAGYKVEQIDLAGESVVFRKPLRGYHVRRQGNTVLWSGEMIKALRQYMELNQAQFADRLGVRQQTVSEWETGAYAPRRATCKHLTLVAEQAAFPYGDNHKA